MFERPPHIQPDGPDVSSNAHEDPHLDKIASARNFILSLEENRAGETEGAESSGNMAAPQPEIETGPGLDEIRALIKAKRNRGELTPKSSDTLQKTKATGKEELLSTPENRILHKPQPYVSDVYYSLPQDQQVLGRLIDKSLVRDTGFIADKKALLDELKKKNTSEALRELSVLEKEIAMLQVKMETDRRTQDRLRKWDVTAKLRKIEDEEPEVTRAKIDEDHLLIKLAEHERNNLPGQIQFYEDRIIEYKNEIKRIQVKKIKKPRPTIIELEAQITEDTRKLAQLKLFTKKPSLEKFMEEAELAARMRKQTGKSEVSIDHEIDDTIPA